jgi:Uma2 family endonuclease
MNAHHAILTDAGAEGTPDFVVEILSPKTARLDYDNKRRIYTSTGVEELWIIPPQSQKIEVFHLQKNATAPAVTHDAEARFTSALFPGLEFDAARIFAR